MRYEIEFRERTDDGKLVSGFAKESGDLRWVIVEFLYNLIDWYRYSYRP